MLVRRLELANVRNIECLRVELDAGVNLLVGPNGAGKTAVLEALHMLVRGRSFRGRAEAVIRHEQPRMVVVAECEDVEMGTVRLAQTRERAGNAQTRRDGRLVRQSSAVATLLPLQLLLPDLAELVFGAPAVRRQWLDWGTFHVKHDHARNLRDYLRVLRHRNVLLRRGDLRALDSWTAQVAELGEGVAEARQGYFAAVCGEVESCSAKLCPDVPLEMAYFQGWPQQNLAQTLADQHENDVKSGTTNSGPHRADIRLAAQGQPAATVLSRGQGKAVASALRLGQAASLMKEDGKRSLFLIDDVGAELDRVHSERFYALLDEMGCQVVATSAHEEAAELLMRSRRGRMFHVKQGRLLNSAGADAE